MQTKFNVKILFVTILLLTLSNKQLWSQARFQGAGVLGFTLSQIDGDDLLGFNKLGLSSGIKVKFQVKNKIDGNVELLYSQRGASASLFTRNDEDIFIGLNYFELPIYVSINDWYKEKEKYYKMSAHAGLSYGQIISSTVSNTPFSDTEFSSSDISYILGASIHFTPKWALTARYTRSINRLLRDDSLRTEFLLGYFWTIRSEFYF